MKPLFSIDLTHDKKNENPVADAFVTARAEQSNVSAYEDYCEDGSALVETAKAPLLLRLLRTVCGIFGVALLGGFLKALVGEDAISLSNLPPIGWLIPIVGALLLGAFFLILRYERSKAKNVAESTETERLVHRGENLESAILYDLSVPEDAARADVLLGKTLYDFA